MILKISLCVNLALLLALIVCILIIKGQSKKIKQYKEKLDSMEQILEGKNEIEKQKDKITTSDDSANFAASLDILHHYAENKRK